MAPIIRFPLSISSVNVTKSQFPMNLVTFTEEILIGKLCFLCSVSTINKQRNIIRVTLFMAADHYTCSYGALISC